MITLTSDAIIFSRSLRARDARSLALILFFRTNHSVATLCLVYLLPSLVIVSHLLLPRPRDHMVMGLHTVPAGTVIQAHQRPTQPSWIFFSFCLFAFIEKYPQCYNACGPGSAYFFRLFTDLITQRL